MTRWLAMFLFAAACAREASPPEDVESTRGELQSVPTFGTNPGGLRMYRYVPANMPPGAPLVVAMHGCTQPASDFELTGFSAMADKYKFYVVYPEQTSANNPATCFDWFGRYNQPSDKTNLQRGKGENESIAEMVAKMKADYSIDGTRVFVVGFSAGGSMASVMLAAWPDLFAAGAMFAGTPYDCPSTQNADVWNCISPGKDLSPSEWGNRVRAAFPGFTGKRPRVSVWQGAQDTTVNTANQRELLDQWTDVLGASRTAAVDDTVGGFPHHLFKDGSGATVVESFEITGMGHGVPLDPAHGCGAAGSYRFDRGSAARRKSCASSASRR
jgi:poly(hydroxyalkanoate) depolymerase family esterase